MLEATDFLLVNPWQRGFPLVPRPFTQVGAKAGLSGKQALARLRRLQELGVIDRVGPVFRPNTVGASVLGTIAVPPERLEAVARKVNAFAGVNHNYEREHRYNLWFVATGADEQDVRRTVSGIEIDTGLRVLTLPLIEEFHIDLGFDLDSQFAPRSPFSHAATPVASEKEKRLVAATARGLPLVRSPYREIGGKLGLGEEQVIALLERMLADGRIRRIGAVVRHRRLGFQANAMVVWDVPDEGVTALGQALAADPGVTLCYRRARALPDWPYNLYCMVHGRERGRTLSEIKHLDARHGLGRFAHAVLFSARCFSQRAANYG